jgi:AmiR/NasT family two-component response regulator
MKRIRRDELMTVVLTTAERDLLLDDTFVDGELRTRIENAVEAGTAKTMVRLTPDGLNELLEWIAAAANHVEEQALESRLEALYDRLVSVEKSLDVYE